MSWLRYRIPTSKAQSAVNSFHPQYQTTAKTSGLLKRSTPKATSRGFSVAHCMKTKKKRCGRPVHKSRGKKK